MRDTPLLENPHRENALNAEKSQVSSAPRSSWNSAQGAKSSLEPGQAWFLLRRQLDLLEKEVLNLPYGSQQVAEWELETEQLLTEICGQAAYRMRTYLYRFQHASPVMELPPQTPEWQLQNHYGALQRMRQKLLYEVLDQLELAPGGTYSSAIAEHPALPIGSSEIVIENSGETIQKGASITGPHSPAMERQTSTQVDTFLFSDLHLGSDVSRCKELLQLLQSYSFKRLILLGDIFDDLNFKRLRRDHWEILSWLRKLSDPDRKVEIIWILGNHDLLLENVSNFVGIEVRDKYVWEHGGKRFLAIHGHQFDRFLQQNVVISEVATFLYLLVQKLDTKKQRFSRLLKRMSKKWLRLSHQVALRAARYARMQGADYVFCGHTHRAVAMQLEGVGYFNTGCWTDVPSHFITIDSENRIQLHEQD